MSKPTGRIDDLIREALAAEDQQVLDGLGDQSSLELLTEVFRGRHRFVATVGMIVTLILFVVGVWAAVAFANAEELRTMLLYAGTSALCFSGVVLVKIWYWLEMMRLALTRELKRLELQVAHLSGRVRG